MTLWLGPGSPAWSHPSAGSSTLGSYPDVLEKPGAHDVGGMFGQDTPLVLGGAIVLMQDAQVLI